ncbi:MAG: right-handed parallel beta-helix repeat-containing protein, partial [Lentisphaeria bacterium]|nr:right-handed parallel beta-helix repeat-containing protein [Lentisphaeria bacterium]
NDAWSGALSEPAANGADGPLASLQRARDRLRGVPPGTPRRICLRGGTYFLDGPLLLTAQDSGTAEAPYTLCAQEGESVLLSGGRRVTGWRERPDGLWAAGVPDAGGVPWDFRQLRTGETMQTLARHPDPDPADPLKTGWLFARESRSGMSPWLTSVARIHTPGDWIAWDVSVPRAGEYLLWLYYGQYMAPFGRTDMDGCTAVQVDGGPEIALMNLPDTGAWSTFLWSQCAVVSLRQGVCRLRWTNRKGGGINLNALALCTDPDWQPREAPPEAAGPDQVCLVVQAQDHAEAKGRELTVERGAAKGRPDEIPFAPGDIPEGEVAGGQVTIFPAWGWVGGPVQIASIDREAGILRLRGRNASQEIRPGNRYAIQNVRFALDCPGEFFFDRENRELLLRSPSEGFSGEEAVVPVLDRLIEIRGEEESGSWAEHIRIEGIAFRDARYSIEVDSLYTPDDAAIRIDRARHVTIEKCTFSHLGGYAVRLAQRASHCRVLRCTMAEMGQGGVIARGETADQPTDCTVAGCHMRDLGRVYKHVAGVYVTTGSRFLVSRNTIHDVPRYAISFKSYGENAASHDCIAEYNDLRRTNLETNDTGAIETLGRDRQPSGNIIRYNLVLDTVGMKHTPEGGIVSPFYTWGIYLDDYSSGTTVVGNIVARNVRGGYHNHLGFDNTVENNIFVDGTLYQAEWNGREEMRRNTFRRNIMCYRHPEAVYIRSGGWHPEVLRECDGNVLWWTGGNLAESAAAVTPAGPWSKWLELGFDRHSVIADPLFVDPAADDYRLRPESPALRLGFRPIPVDEIGADAYRD